MSRAAALVVAFAAVLRAALRVGWIEPRASLPELVSRLRSARRSRRASQADPRLVLGLLEALLPLLPPYGAGRCMKRSLLLLDIWSRAGLEPSIHLGVRGEGNGRGGHAWVTTRRADLDTFLPPDVEEAWRA